MRRRTEDFCPIHRAKVCSDRIFIEENRLSLHANIVCMLGGHSSLKYGIWGVKGEFEVGDYSASEVL